MENIIDNNLTTSLLCDEVLDFSAFGNKTPERLISSKEAFRNSYPDIPPTVRALHDESQIHDRRILQNLLRNEDKYLPPVPDYLYNAQRGNITAAMRKMVSDWMLDVVHEQNSSPEVFCLAMNIMDRFLSSCQVVKSQLQLIGSVCILIASKIREPCPIPGRTLIIYTDNSITADEIKDWELLILSRVQWELTAITSADFLDHVIPRLGLSRELLNSDLRRRAETILVLCATEYKFSYHSPSILAASAILIALKSLSEFEDYELKEIKLRLQTATHTGTNPLEECTKQVNDILPSNLQAINTRMEVGAPDSTGSPVKIPSETTSTSSSEKPEIQSEIIVQTELPQSIPLQPETVQQQQQQQTHVEQMTVLDHDEQEQQVQLSPEPDLMCNELLNDTDLSDETETLCSEQEQFVKERFLVSPDSSSRSTGYSLATTTSSDSRSSSPLSAVDIFTDFNNSVLKDVFEKAEQSTYSILVT